MSLKKILYILIGISFAIAGSVYAVQTTIPTTPSSGYFWIATSTGNAISTTTDPIHAGSFYATSTTATSIFNGLLRISTTTAGCAQFNPVGLIFSTGVNCGTGSGGGSWPFTPATHWQQATQGTTTALWLQGSPFSLFASSTVVFDSASTSLLTVPQIFSGGSTFKLSFIGGSCALGFCNANIISGSGGDQTYTLPNLTGTFVLGSNSNLNTVAYWNSFGSITDSSNLTFNGTVLGANGGLISNASSTFASAVRFSSLAQGYGFIGTNGLFQTVSTTTLGTNIFATSSNTIYIDSSRSDTYTANGTVLYPYTSISAANTAVTNANLPSIDYEISPGTYTEQTLTMPNVPTVVHSKGSTLIVLSGASLGAGTITFPSDFTWYDGAIFGNVKATNSSLTNPHGFVGTFIAGNLTFSGLGTFINGAIVDQNKTPFPFLSQNASSTITTDNGALSNFLGNRLQAIVVNRGTLNLDDNDVNVSTSTLYAITSTTTGSVLHISGLSVENFGTGGAIDARNSAPASSPNAMNSIFATEGAGSTNGIEMGTAVTYLNDYAITTVAGVSLYGTPNFSPTSGVRPLNQAGLIVEGNSLLNFQGGFTGIGTTTPFTSLQVSSTTGSATFKPQFVLSDFSAGANLKHWYESSEQGLFFIGTTSDAYATSTKRAFQIDTNGFPSFAALSGVGCAQFNATGQLTNTGSGCGSSSGLTSYDAWTHPVQGQSATTSLMLFNGQASSTQLSANIGFFNFLNATGTTATSTFSGNVRILGQGTGAAKDNALNIDCSGRIWPASVSVGGCLNLDENTQSQSPALVIHDNSSGVGTGRLMVINQEGSSVTQDMIIASSGGTNVTALNLKGFPSGKGVLKIEHTGGTGNSSGSGLSIDTTTGDAQGMFIKVGTGIPINVQNSSSATLFKVDSLGNASTTGFLDVNSTNATSTFAYSIKSPCFTNNGTSCITGGGGSGTVTSITAGAGHQNQGAVFTTSGTLVGAIATSAIPTVGNLAFWNFAGDATTPGKLGTVATTTLTGTAPITFSQPISVIGGSASIITCAVATASVPGCLAAADFTTFNAKLGSYNAWTNFSNLYSATTSNLLIATTTGGLGVLTSASSTGSQLVLSANGGVNNWAMRNAGGDLFFSSTTVAGTATTSTAALTIKGTGKPGIAISTTSPTATFTVESRAGDFNYQMYIGSTTSPSFYIDNSKHIFVPNITAATGGTNQTVCFKSTTGELIDETTTACAVSDENQKHDIQKLNVNALDLVSQLKTISYSMNDDVPYDYQNTQYGFTAQQVASVDPHLAEYGIDGKPRNLDDRAILATVVKSIQELSAKGLTPIKQSDNKVYVLGGLFLLYIVYNEIDKRKRK